MPYVYVLFVGSVVALGTGDSEEEDLSFTIGEFKDSEVVSFTQWFGFMDEALKPSPFYGKIPFLGVGYSKFLGLDMTQRADVNPNEFDYYEGGDEDDADECKDGPGIYIEGQTESSGDSQEPHAFDGRW